MNIIEIISNAYSGYASYLWHEITHPSIQNYFYWLLVVSLFFFGVEYFQPWRKNQPKFRKDFWLDIFYMFFNFFIFSLIIYNAASEVVVVFFNDLILNLSSIDLKTLNPMYTLPLWGVLLIGFLVRDFVQWCTHRLLHRFDFLWQFHKVHHSVQEMGFAAHLRYHWMETIVYRSIEYVPLALLGIGLYDFFIIHIFTLAIGHYNHSNISVNGRITGGVVGAFIGCIIGFGFLEIELVADPPFLWSMSAVLICLLTGAYLVGPFMKKIFNSPEMHIWHHAEHLPAERSNGVNFGLSLAIWDYLFGTAYIPKDGRDIKLGFDKVEEFPQSFLGQITYGFKKK